MSQFLPAPYVSAFISGAVQIGYNLFAHAQNNSGSRSVEKYTNLLVVQSLTIDNIYSRKYILSML